MKTFTEEEILRINKIVDQIGLMEMCFSGASQEKEYQSINTQGLNDLFLAVRYLKKENAALKLKQPDHE